MNLKHFGNYFLFFLLLNLSLFSLDARERDLKVPKGKQTILKTRAIRKIAIGNSSIADVKAIGRTKLLILGKNVGSTSLIIFHSKGKQSLYNITVTPIDPRGIIAEIVKILGNREGIFVHAVGDKVVLDGKALTAEDYRRIIKIKKLC